MVLLFFFVFFFCCFFFFGGEGWGGERGQGNMLIRLFLSGNIGKYFMGIREQNKFYGNREYGNFENYF